MGCLYCGRDIGTLRLLQDNEFCSSAHRKSYSERLAKALNQMAAPVTAPARMAGFFIDLPIQQGDRHQGVLNREFRYTGLIIHYRDVAIPGVLGENLPSLAWPDFAAASPGRPRTMEARLPLPDIALPQAVDSCDRAAIEGPGPVRGREARIADPPLPRVGEPCALPRALPALLVPSLASLQPVAEPGSARERAAAKPAILCAEPIAAWPARIARPPMPAATEPRPVPHSAPALRLPAPVSAADTHAPAMALAGLRPARQAQVAKWPLRAAMGQPRTPYPAPALCLSYPAERGHDRPQPVAAEWLRAPAPAPAAGNAGPWAAADMYPMDETQRLDFLRLAIDDPLAGVNGDWRPAPAAEPARQAGTPVTRAAFPAAVAVRFPGLENDQPEMEAPADRRTIPPSEAIAVRGFPADSSPAMPPFTPVPADTPPAVELPELAFPGRPERGSAGFEHAGPPASAPEHREPDARPAVLEAIPTILVKPPEAHGEPPVAAVPRPDVIPMEFYCQRGTARPTWRREWRTQPVELALPRFALRLLVEQRGEPAPFIEPPKKPTFAEIFTMPEFADWRRRSSAMPAAVKAIAASLLVGVAMWFGAGSVQLGRQLLDGDRTASTIDAISGASKHTAFAARSRNAAAARLASAGAPQGTMARLRRAIATRAAGEWNDAFQAGMKAWGSAPGAMAPGWSRNPEGYVRPGALALYQPSLEFADYRMEFFGQIESKSVGWVVRARDGQNYLAMKMAVVAPGLRPVVALVQYPVVDGHRGRAVEVPLTAMMHNNTPYRIAVSVKGNRVTTSIEGQEVEGSIDDTLKAGGVGFFSEAGARARLYWMKVSRNQDWLGRVCALFSGAGGKTETAEWWQPDVSGGPPDSAPRAPAPHSDSVLLAADYPRPYAGPQPARASKNRRLYPWES